MRYIVIICILGGLQWAYSNGMFTSKPELFNANGEAQTILYTAEECGSPCTNMSNELKRRRVKFEEVQISLQNESHPNNQQFKAHNGGSTLPYMVNGNQSGVITTVPEVASQLALSYGEEYLTRYEKKLYEKHFDANGDPIVVMYGAEWCGYCRKLEKQLDESNIDFVEIDLDAHRDKKVIGKTLNIGGYPTTWYGYERVRGSDVKAVKRTMKLSTQ